MPKLILHEHPEQNGGCLESLVRYAQTIPLRFSTLEDIAVYLRNRPFQRDAGLLESAVPVDDYKLSGCTPWQRQRVWPDAYNCWEATAHFLRHALQLLKGDEIIEIWDRTLPTGSRHVWPTLKNKAGIWLVQLEGRPTTAHGHDVKAANFGWEDVLGGVHAVGAGVLGFFLGADRAAPIVQQAEKLWGSNIAEWSKSGKEAAKAGEQAKKLASYISQTAKQESTQTTQSKTGSETRPTAKDSMAFDEV